MNFTVPDMSCGHCTAAIEKSIKAADPDARVTCDIPAHIVTVDSHLPAADLAAAMKAAGYDSTVVA